ncbi:MAG: glycosyltransferase family 9 protein [Thermodesulfobacteriota bacterium]|nr:glycosyltransferase family 9 protein [Thermodesulfobacteriota bacterium]
MVATAEKDVFPPSVLIVLMGSLGDVVRGLPLVSHIKDGLPGSRVTWLVEPKWVQLVRVHPHIDRVIVFNRPKGLLAVRDLYKDLSQEHFDISLDLQRHLKSGFFSLISRAKRRIGFHRRDAKEFNWLFNNEHLDYVGDQLPKLRHYLKFTDHLGLSQPSSLDFGFSALDLETAGPSDLGQTEDPFVAVVMGSSWESKNWFLDHYCQLVRDVLNSTGMCVVLVGSHQDTTLALRLSDSIKAPRLINLVGKTSLLELVAVLKAAAVGVGPDSGPGHLAAAVGTPYVSLFGPTSPVRTAPYGSEHLVLQSGIDCAPCYERRCPGLDRLCMRLISPKKVKEKLVEALASQGLA